MFEYNICMATHTACYKSGAAGHTRVPKGIVVHSTGANNPNLNRYVGPDDGILGVNKYGNYWNRDGVRACVNGCIGYDKDKIVRFYQLMPWDFPSWGVGNGKKGSYNDTHIQWEICEDGLINREYFDAVMKKSVEACAYLIGLYPSISVDNIVSHHEAYLLGYGSNHADIDHWLKKFGYTMNDFRQWVKNELTIEPEEPKEKDMEYIVHAGVFSSNVVAQEAVKSVKAKYPNAYVSSMNGVYIARCELNKNREYALKNAEALEELVDNPGIIAR